MGRSTGSGGVSLPAERLAEGDLVSWSSGTGSGFGCSRAAPLETRPELSRAAEQQIFRRVTVLVELQFQKTS